MNDVERLTKIESDLAHLSKLFDDLNKVVTDQNKEIFDQSRTIKRLKDELKTLKEKPSGGESFSLEDEKPPHY